MNITLLTGASQEYKPIIELSAPNKLEYCLRHNIQFTNRVHSDALSMQELGAERQQYMLDALKECDWLWFMGADTLIMNYNKDIRDYIDNDYHFIIGEDVNGINNDSFLLKNCKESINFLERSKNYSGSLANDQECMKLTMRLSFGFKYSIVPQRQFNSMLYSEYNYPDDKGGSYQPGDLVLHFAGMSNAKRVPLMYEYLTEVIGRDTKVFY